MGEIVDLGRPKLPTRDDHEFVTDLARFAEGLLDEKAIRKKYRMFDDTVWTQLADDDSLVRSIEAESVRRVRDGSAKKEKAQQLILKGPTILDSIMSDPSASPRHRVDAIKTLDSFTGGPEQSAPQSDRFIISIILNSDGAGGEPLHFNKRITPLEPGEIDLDDNSPDTGVVAAIAAKKTTENGGGDAI